MATDDNTVGTLSNVVLRLMQGSLLYRLLSDSVTVTTEAIADARTVRMGRATHTLLLGAVTQSYCYRWLGFLQETTTHSYCYRGFGLLQGTTTQSYCYRWLTAEPDPDVIVIDLRETWTVGPLLKLMTTAVAWVLPFWRSSACRRAVGKFQNIGNYFTDSHTGTILTSVFAPPQEPETDTQEEPEQD